MPLSFAGNPNFVNKLPPYTFNIQLMFDNFNFSFLLWNKLHLYFVTFLLSVSIKKNLYTIRKLKKKLNYNTKMPPKTSIKQWLLFDNLIFSFLLWNILHLYFVTFLLSVSIKNPLCHQKIKKNYITTVTPNCHQKLWLHNDCKPT